MRLIDITDFQDPALDVYARISEGQLLNRAEPEKGMFIAESPKVIRRALQAGYQPVSFLVENRLAESNHETRELLEEWEGMDIPIYTAEFDVLTQLTGFMLTRGMLCAMYRPKMQEPEEICAKARRIAVLENVVNPTNVGAIFRSAAALGIDAVLLTRNSCDPLNRRAVRVSMGTVFLVPWTWMDGSLGDLGRLGFRTAAMALTDNSISIDNPVLATEPRLAIVMGTEGDGLSQETIAAANYVVRIPMSHGVAAAAAVAFWQLRAPNPQ